MQRLALSVLSLKVVGLRPWEFACSHYTCCGFTPGSPTYSPVSRGWSGMNDRLTLTASVTQCQTAIWLVYAMVQHAAHPSAMLLFSKIAKISIRSTGGTTQAKPLSVCTWIYLLLVNESLILVTLSGLSFSFSLPEGSCFIFFSFPCCKQNICWKSSCREALQFVLNTVQQHWTSFHTTESCFSGRGSWHRKNQLDNDLFKWYKILIQREGEKKVFTLTSAS